MLIPDPLAVLAVLDLDAREGLVVETERCIPDDSIQKLMNFIQNMMDFIRKMMDFVLKLVEFERVRATVELGGTSRGAVLVNRCDVTPSLLHVAPFYSDVNSIHTPLSLLSTIGWESRRRAILRRWTGMYMGI